MPRLFLILPACLMLSACIQSNPAQTKIYTPYGKVTYKCPPGHAMKGECYSPHAMPGKGQKHK